MNIYNELNVFFIDIDGVACEHIKAICKWVNKEYKINSKVEDVTTWNHNFGPINVVDAIEKCYHSEDFILNMEITPGFHEFLGKIIKIMEVKFVSTRKEYCHNFTRLWIKKKFGDEFEILFVGKKADLNFDYLVDDNPKEVIAAASRDFNTCFLLCRPWNNNEDEKSKLNKFKQVHFMESFYDIICFINNTTPPTPRAGGAYRDEHQFNKI